MQSKHYPDLEPVQVEYYHEGETQEETIWVKWLPRAGDLITFFIDGEELKRRVNTVEFFVANNQDGYPEVTLRLDRR